MPPNGQILTRINIREWIEQELDATKCSQEIRDELYILMTNNFINEVEKEYTNIPFHNFNHALKKTRDAIKLIKRCNKYNIPVNTKIVLYAMLWHDAGYHTDAKSKWYATKEQYSAFIIDKILNKYKEESYIVKRVVNAILATQGDMAPRNTEEKIVRAADLMDMAWPYEGFVRDNRLLFQEYQLLVDPNCTRSQRKEKTQHIIEFYLAQDIYLTPEHDDEQGDSIFHTRARNNLEKFLHEDNSEKFDK